MAFCAQLWEGFRHLQASVLAADSFVGLGGTCPHSLAVLAFFAQILPWDHSCFPSLSALSSSPTHPVFLPDPPPPVAAGLYQPQASRALLLGPLSPAAFPGLALLQVGPLHCLFLMHSWISLDLLAASPLLSAEKVTNCGALSLTPHYYLVTDCVSLWTPRLPDSPLWACCSKAKSSLLVSWSDRAL